MPRKKKASPAKVYATGKRIKKERVEKKSSDITSATTTAATELKNTPGIKLRGGEGPLELGTSTVAPKKNRTTTKKAAKKAPASGTRITDAEKLKSTLKSDAPERTQDAGRPGAPEMSSEGVRQATMKESAQRAANPETRYDLSEVPFAPKKADVKAVSAAKEDPKLTPKPTIEPLPSENQLKRDRLRNEPLARPQKTSVFTGGSPQRYEAPLTDPSRDEDRLRKGMGIAGEEKGIVSHAISLLNRDNAVMWRQGKLVEKPAIATSYNDVRDTHQHRLAKVLHTFKVSEDALQAHAQATAGGSRKAYEDTISGLHEVTQQHNDFYGAKIKQVPGPTDLWEHPTLTDPNGFKKTFPVMANHPDMPSAFMRSKQKITRVNILSDGSMGTSDGYEGWDSFKAAGGTVWRQQTAPKGTDLVDHLRGEILNNHAEGASLRARKVKDAGTILDSLAGGNKVIGMRERGKAEPKPGLPTVKPRPINRKGKPGIAMAYPLDQGQNSVAEALVVEKPGPTGLPEGRAKTDRQPKARSGRVRVTKGTKGLPAPSSVVIDTKEKMYGTEAGTQVPASKLLKPVVDKNAMLPDRVAGAAVVSEPKKVKQSKEDKDLAIAQSRSKAEKARGIGPLAKGTVNIAGKPSMLQNPQMALPGFENVEKLRVGSRAQRLLAESGSRGREATPREPIISQDAISGEVPRVSKDATTRTGMQELRDLKESGAIDRQKRGVGPLAQGSASVNDSMSREVAVRGGSRNAKIRAEKAARQTRQRNTPMEQPMLPIKELRSSAFALGGSVQPVSEKTRALQGDARKPSRSSNPIYEAANKILEENKDK
jgi:hypothetical protein